MKKIFEFIDKLLCRYIGLDKPEITPHIIQKTKKKWLLINTESFKRHTHPSSVEKFTSAHLDKLTDNSKELLGISLGKSIAKNLVISFEKVYIKKEEK